MKCSGATLTKLSMSVILFFKSNGRQLVIRLLVVIKHRHRSIFGLGQVRATRQKGNAGAVI
jgi:hypothetical protein